MRRLTAEDVHNARRACFMDVYPQVLPGDKGIAAYLNALLFADNDEFRTKDEPRLCGLDCGGSSLRLSQGWDVVRRRNWVDGGDCESVA